LPNAVQLKKSASAVSPALLNRLSTAIEKRAIAIDFSPEE
jgi:hypothetical protein